MGDGEDAGEVRGDRINCSNQPIAPFSILSPKSLINNQHLQSRARPLRQQSRQRQPYRKINPKSFAAGVSFIGASPASISN